MPRDIGFHLPRGTVQEVEDTLREAGFAVPLREDDCWRYPSAQQAVLYARVRLYSLWMLDLQEEFQLAVEALGGQIPVVWVFCEVSNHHPGDEEVRMLARLVLGRFGGCSFDGYAEHGWTLDEIESDARIEGLRYFDYRAFNDLRAFK